MKIKPSLLLLYIWLLLFGLFPLVLATITSFLTPNTANLASLPFTLNNYKALCSPIFVKIFLRSFSMAIITTVGSLIIAYPFSYLLIKSKHKSFLLLLIIIPFWTSSLIRTYALMAILKFKGLLNAFLLYTHIINIPLPFLYTNFAVISGLIYTLFPFMVLPIFTNMERFDFRLIEAAKDLGANRWGIFTRVFLPNTASGIIAGSLMVLLPAMTLFYIPNILGGARSILLGNLIQDQFLVFENWPLGSATSVLLTVLLLGFLILSRRQNSEIMV